MVTFWLLKTEPDTYSFEQLQKDGSTNWNGVRNFQARKYIKEMKEGDTALIYHSGQVKGVVGIAKISRTAYPDPDPKKPGEWVQVDLKPIHPLKRSVLLSEIKATPELMTLPLIRQSRLSVMPITKAHFNKIVKLGGGTP
jgi:predicted RNA-binding protein with PUA-like domain